MRRSHAWAAALLLTCAPFAPASAQTASPPLAASDPLAAAFDALPERERKAVQEALIWTGDYLGVVDGEFGRRSREAFLAFDRRGGPGAEGLPSPAKLKALYAAAGRARQASGFAVVSDATGARIGVPKALLSQTTRSPAASRYASKDGRITLDLAAIDAPDMTLETLFERLKTESATRRVTYRLARPDFVVVAGETQGRKFYTRFAAGADGQGKPILRGFSFYAPADRPELDRLTIAVANSFEPFPGAAPTPPPGLSAQPSVPPTPTISATAISLGAGKYLAALPDGCANATLADAPARFARRGKDGLALIEGVARPPAALAAAVPPEGAPAFAVGYHAPPGETGRLYVASGKLNGAGALVAGLQPGMTGAPVFDRDGRFLGLARPFAPSRLVAGVAPAAPYVMIPAQDAVAFAAIPASAPTSGAERGAGGLAQTYRAALAPVKCLR